MFTSSSSQSASQKLNGNSQPLPSQSSAPDWQQFQVHLNQLKQDLSRVRGRERNEMQERLQHLVAIAEQFEQWIGTALENGQAQDAPALLPPQQWVTIAHRLAAAPSLEALLTQAVEEVFELTGGDRALIYRFDPNTPSQGVVLAEALTYGWTPAKGETLPAVAFGAQTAADYQDQAAVILGSGEADSVTPYQRQLLEKYQVQTSLSLPMRVDGKIWGLLVVQHCERTHTWSDAAINLLYQLASEVALKLVSFDFQAQLQQQQVRSQTVTNVINKIRQSQDLNTIFEVATKEVRKVLQADRVAIYRFNADWSGSFVAESMAPGWTALVNSQTPDPAGEVDNDCSLRMIGENPKVIRDTYLQETQGGGYARGQRYSIVNDIYEMGFSRCYLDQLETYEARAYINVPIFQGDKLWGLLAVYQNSGPRQWTDAEKDLMLQIADQLAVALQQAEYVEALQKQAQAEAQAAEQEKTKVAIISRIRQSQDLETIFKVTTQEVRKGLKVDRAALYRFHPDWSGEFVAESVASGWKPLVGGEEAEVKDTYLQETQGGRYAQGESLAVNDIYTVGHQECHIEILESFQARAYVLVPVFEDETLWGLLAVYQNSGPRQWQESEVQLLRQVGLQLGIALKQAEYVGQIQSQSQQLAQAVEREKTKAAIVSRIRQTQDLDTIFKVTTQEVRKVLQGDRCLVYQFNPDWSGQVVAESVDSGWVSLLIEQSNDEVLSGDRTSNERCILRKWSVGDITDTDTYMQTTGGGRYMRGQKYTAIDDIYTQNFPACYIASLEKYQAKAYIIVPIFQGEKLWGLLGVYQNSGPRTWQEPEVELMLQIADQLAVALQQAEYLLDVQRKSEQLAQGIEREQAVAKVVDRIRKTQEVSTIFETTTNEVRSLLKADRVALYQFRPDWSGEFVAESVASGWKRLVGGDDAVVKDTYLQEHQGGRYVRGESLAVDDIYTIGHEACHIELLESFQARAYVLVPVFEEETLWGLLAVYQNSGPRQWQDAEVQLLQQIGAQLGIALKQAEFVEQIRQQSQQLAAAAERERAAKELLQQRAIQLLSAVRPALDGDLTVRAPVTSDELGTIADAYNNTLQGLREIVVQVQSAAQKVAQTSTDSDREINKLSEQAQRQTQSLADALTQVEQMTRSTQGVANNAQAINQAVQKSNQTVESGDKAMNRTVEGIEAIREVVAQTSRNIRELGESSQKISRVVNLISDFSKQTQLLSLNASIEATRAGEYGRGFAVVADEVRSLARQSAEATKEIEDLVSEIRNQTQEAIKVTESAIAQVSAGTHLVQETRGELNAIAAATAEISRLVEQIAQATLAQLDQSQSVTQTMQEVAGVSTATSEEAIALSASFKTSLETAQQLQAAVDKFKI